MSPEAAVAGSFLVIALGVGILIFATRTYRQSASLFRQAMAQPLSEPIDLICGVRMGWLNVTSPFGRVRIAEEGLKLSGFGRSAQVTWSEIAGVDLVKPFNGVGWGVRVRSGGRPDIIVWVLNRALADRIVEACELRGVQTERQARLVL